MLDHTPIIHEKQRSKPYEWNNEYGNMFIQD